MANLAQNSIVDRQISPLLNELSIDKFVIDSFPADGELYFLALFSDNEIEESGGSIFYETTVKKACDRLEILGFTLNYAKNSLALNQKNFQTSLSFFNERFALPEIGIHDFRCDLHSIENAYRFIINKYSRCGLFDKLKYDTDASLLVNYLVAFNSFHNENYKLPYLRFMLSLFDDHKIVRQNLDNIAENLFYFNNLDLKSINYKSYHQSKIFDEYLRYAKIIILTEGKTDLQILSRSLKILYAHLYDFYHFMDFGVTNSKGGASSLIDSLKGFIGSGINNRVIGILDNDTAAYVAKKPIEKIDLPHNIKLIHYPDLDFATSYPTLGPTGKQLVNVNGLAGSLELYLGKDILCQDNGNYLPVQWKGYDQSLDKYQGEVINKDIIQKKFNEKLAICENDASRIDDYDWSGIRVIWEAIFNCFK